MKSPTITIMSSVLSQELGEETMLLNLANETYYGLDSVGTRIWQLLLEHHDIESVVTQMLAEYDVPAAQLYQDVRRLLDELAQSGLITVAAT